MFGPKELFFFLVLKISLEKIPSIMLNQQEYDEQTYENFFLLNQINDCVVIHLSTGLQIDKSLKPRKGDWLNYSVWFDAHSLFLSCRLILRVEIVYDVSSVRSWALQRLSLYFYFVYDGRSKYHVFISTFLLDLSRERTEPHPNSYNSFQFIILLWHLNWLR